MGVRTGRWQGQSPDVQVRERGHRRNPDCHGAPPRRTEYRYIATDSRPGRCGELRRVLPRAGAMVVKSASEVASRSDSRRPRTGVLPSMLASDHLPALQPFETALSPVSLKPPSTHGQRSRRASRRPVRAGRCRRPRVTGVSRVVADAGDVGYTRGRTPSRPLQLSRTRPNRPADARR